ncbi:uncharacterized protein [Dermacentor albipictus]|uniref:uncharacterized protein isoform X2 n=1 Tax=Dermacentor albipictus TaxID=60249 RepID=UPI0038FD0C63
MKKLTPGPQPAARKLIPEPASPVSLEGIHWSSMSCSEPEPDTCTMSHSPPLSDFSYGSDAGYVQLPLPDCNMGRPLVYLGSFLGLLCAVGGVATATFVLAGGPHVRAALEEVAGLDRADSDMNIELGAAARITAVPARMPSPKPGRAAPKREQWSSRRRSSATTRASLDDYDEDSMNVAYNDDEEDLPSAYEMRRYADELMRHSNEFAKFRTTPTPTSPASEARQARKKGAATGTLPPIWRDRQATALTSGTAGHVMTPPPRTPFSASQGADASGSNTKAVGSERPLTTSSDTKASSATTETQSGGKVKSIETGGVGTDVNPDVTASNRPRGLLAALPLPTKAHGPGPRSLLCLVEGGVVRPGPPLHECSHLILGDQVFDFMQRVIRPPRRGSGGRAPLPMTTAAMAEQVRALRSESAPGLRLLVGLRPLDVENTYVHLWSNRSGLAASANLAYEWVRRAGLDGIALTNLVVGRHTVDAYVNFLKRLRALFREDYLIVFGFFHRESHEHDHAYTENAIRTIVRLCSFTVFEAHDVRPRPCRSFVMNALDGYRYAISNATIMSSLAVIRRLGVPRDQTCVSMSLAVMRFLMYDRPRRFGQVCHNYFPESYSMVAALVRSSGIPCVAVYNVELDDATGSCDSETPYSRLTAVATALRGATIAKQTTAVSKSTPRKGAVGPSETTVSRHRHKVRKRVLVAVKRRRH